MMVLSADTSRRFAASLVMCMTFAINYLVLSWKKAIATPSSKYRNLSCMPGCFQYWRLESLRAWLHQNLWHHQMVFEICFMPPIGRGCSHIEILKYIELKGKEYILLFGDSRKCDKPKYGPRWCHMNKKIGSPFLRTLFLVQGAYWIPLENQNSELQTQVKGQF